MSPLKRIARNVFMFSAGVVVSLSVMVIVTKNMPEPNTACTCIGRPDCHVKNQVSANGEKSRCWQWPKNQSCCRTY